MTTDPLKPIKPNVPDAPDIPDALDTPDVLDTPDAREARKRPASAGTEPSAPVAVEPLVPVAIAAAPPAAVAAPPAVAGRAVRAVRSSDESHPVLFAFTLILAVLYLLPILIVLMNSFKGQFFISDVPFAFPDSQTFVGLQNYLTGIARIGFFSAIGYSMFITVGSVLLLTLFTSMTAWYITRVKGWASSGLYYLFVFSMIVPFQMVMFTMVKIANILKLDNPLGILIIYLGFGAGLSVFMFSGFVKSIPIDIEEAATIDGCNPVQTFFRVVFPILRPTAITVAILNTMWIWNDYLLPYLVIGTRYKTIPVAVQGVLTGSYGGRDMGALMAMLILAILPIVIFYLSSQKYLIKGVVAGAVKG